MTTPDEARALAYRLEAQEVLTMPGQPFTLAAVHPWLRRNDALRSEAAAALRDLSARLAAAEADAAAARVLAERAEPYLRWAFYYAAGPDRRAIEDWFRAAKLDNARQEAPDA